MNDGRVWSIVIKRMCNAVRLLGLGKAVNRATAMLLQTWIHHSHLYKEGLGSAICGIFFLSLSLKSIIGNLVLALCTFFAQVAILGFMHSEGCVIFASKPGFVPNLFAYWPAFLKWIFLPCLFHLLLFLAFLFLLWFAFFGYFSFLEWVLSFLVSWRVASYMHSSWTFRAIKYSCSWDLVPYIPRDTSKLNFALTCCMRCSTWMLFVSQTASIQPPYRFLIYWWKLASGIEK